MNKPNHVEVIRIPHHIQYRYAWDKLDKELNAKYGSENVDWWVKEYEQHSEIIYTVIDTSLNPAPVKKDEKP